MDKDAVPKQVKLEIQSPTSLLPRPGENKAFTCHISKCYQEPFLFGLGLARKTRAPGVINTVVHSC